MRTVSRALGLAMNIRAAAEAHKRSECGADCNVSLHALKEAATAMQHVSTDDEWDEEASEFEALLRDWPL